MNLTKQELALVNFVRGLSFDHLLDAHEGIAKKAEVLQNKANRSFINAETSKARDFAEHASVLVTLANLLSDANEDYRAHVYPELATRVVKYGNETANSLGEVGEGLAKLATAVDGKNNTIQMLRSTVEEVMHLFDVAKDHEGTWSVEFQQHDSADPLMGLTDFSAKVDYLEGDDGDFLEIYLGENGSFSFGIGKCNFSKYISDCQIMICIASDHYAAWFNSGVLPVSAIEKAKDFKVYDEVGLAFDVRDNEAIHYILREMGNLLASGYSVVSVGDSTEHDGHVHVLLNNS